MSEFILWTMPAGAAIYVLLGTITMLSRHRDARGGAHWLMFVLALWVIGSIMQMAATREDIILSGLQLTLASAALVPPLALFTVCHFAAHRIAQHHRVLVILIPIVTIMALATQPWHDLMWTPATTVGAATNGAVVQYGAWFNFVHAPFSFGLCLIAGILLVRFAMRSDPRRRRYLIGFVALTFIPVITSFAHLSVAPFAMNSPTGVAIAFVAPFISWLVLRHGVLIEDGLEHRALFEQMHDGVLVLDDENRVISVNATAEQLLRIDAMQVKGDRLRNLLPDIALAAEKAAEIPGDEQAVVFDSRNLALRVTPVQHGSSGIRVHLLICRDVTVEHSAIRQLARNEDMLRSLINNVSNAILRVRKTSPDARPDEADFCVLIANPVAAQLLDSEPDALVGKTILRALELTKSRDLRAAFKAIVPVLRGAAETGLRAEGEFPLQREDEEHWFKMVVDPVGDDLGIVCTDITRQRQQEIALESAAFMDPLTGVLNRRGFERRASSCLAEQDDDAVGALLFIDLNSFKRVNDIHGHETGDLVLQMVADRLQGAVRDIDMVARIGGDEFVILAPQTPADAANALCERLRECLGEPYQVANMAMNSSASIGLALFPDQGVTLTSLLRVADASMYECKARARLTISGSYKVVSIKE
ncbi:MAG: diguanylate cyclase [Pseudomonadota bacterium]